MNITTENIDEWCFRYLEKDLDAEECTFFENELQKNPSLAKQLSLWKQTIITTESLKHADYTAPENLFRYKNQFLFILIEFILTSLFIIFFISNTAKEIRTRENINSSTSTVLLSSSAHINKDSTFVEEIRLNKQTYINLVLDQQNDSVIVFQNDKKKNIELDTARVNTNQILPIPEEQNQKDSMKIAADTTISQKKLIQKKNTKRHKYRGSRLLPINNDL